MSYARMGGDSNVYIYLDCGGYLLCCWCRFDKVEKSHGFKAYNTQTMLSHLAIHIGHGDKVPEYCLEQLAEDAVENDRWMANPESDYRL